MLSGIPLRGMYAERLGIQIHFLKRISELNKSVAILIILRRVCSLRGNRRPWFSVFSKIKPLASCMKMSRVHQNHFELCKNKDRVDVKYDLLETMRCPNIGQVK